MQVVDIDICYMLCRQQPVMGVYICACVTC